MWIFYELSKKKIEINLIVLFASRANAHSSDEEDAWSRDRWDPSAGQLSRVLYAWYALPDGGDTGPLWILRPGRDELLRFVFCWRSWQVRMCI